MRTTLCLTSMLFAALALAGCHGGPMDAHHGGHYGFTSDTSTIQVVTTELGGKNVFIPSTIVVTDGGPRSLSVFNTTDIPHGFKIEALGVETVLAPGEEKVINLPKLEGGQVLHVGCQLHPAHRGATLVVLRSE